MPFLSTINNNTNNTNTNTNNNDSYPIPQIIWKNGKPYDEYDCNPCILEYLVTLRAANVSNGVSYAEWQHLLCVGPSSNSADASITTATTATTPNGNTCYVLDHPPILLMLLLRQQQQQQQQKTLLPLLLLLLPIFPSDH
jgi:hypothetical protein